LTSARVVPQRLMRLLCLGAPLHGPSTLGGSVLKQQESGIHTNAPWCWRCRCRPKSGLADAAINRDISRAEFRHR
jgi:hypothetical protein